MSGTTVISLQLTNAQYDKLQRLIEFDGLSVTVYTRQAVLEWMEDDEDYRKTQANLATSQGETVSRAGIMKRLGMK